MSARVETRLHLLEQFPLVDGETRGAYVVPEEHARETLQTSMNAWNHSTSQEL